MSPSPWSNWNMAMVLVFELCSISWRDVFWVFVWFFILFFGIYPQRSWVSWSEMGLSNSIAFKVSQEILVHNQSWKPLLNNRTWSNRNLVLPEGHDFPSQKRAISSPSSPQTPVCEGQFGYSLLFIATYCPFILMVPQLNFEPLVTRFHHVLQLLAESSTDPQVSLLFFIILHFTITLFNTTTVDDLLILKPLNSLTSSLPVTLSWATCSHDHTPDKSVYTQIFTWQLPLFRRLASSLLKQHCFFFFLNQKAKSNQFIRKRTGELNQPYKL